MTLTRPFATADEGPALDGVMAVVVNVFVICSFVYLWSFNLLPSAVRLMFATALTVWLLGFAAYELLRSNGHAVRVLWLLFALVGMGWGLQSAFGSISVPLVASSKYLFIAGLFIFALGPARLMSPRVARACAAMTIFGAAAIALTAPGIEFGGSTRLAPFTGGVDGIHSSAFAVIGAAVICAPAMFQRGALRWIMVAAVMVAVALLQGYLVRAAMVTALVYLAGWSYLALSRSVSPMLASLVAMLALLGGCVGLALVVQFGIAGDFVDLDLFSSGRFSAWSDRLQDFRSRSVIELLFGAGPGSDFDYLGRWRAVMKNSHSDFLGIAFEAGLTGLIAIGAAGWMILKRVSPDGFPIVAAIFVSSMITNGVFARPTVFSLFIIALGLIAARRAETQAILNSTPRRSAMA